VDVELLVTHENGCTDTISKELDIVPRPLYFLPNAFRPGGTNDEYRGTGRLDWISEFEMQIFDRWGGVVFVSSDPRTGWNGRRNNTGSMLPTGVYVCKVQFYGPRGNFYVFREFATLIH
jgi:gliding motility-associated-like protein